MIHSDLKSRDLIAANWKMNVLPSESQSLAFSLCDLAWSENIEVLICPPFTHLFALRDLRKDGICLGAQDCHEALKGPYTGEVSALMLKDLNCDYVILGHSERRRMNPHEDQNIHSKIKTAMASDLNVIYCCGESLDIRIANAEKDFIHRQLKKDLFELEADVLDKLTIAYEPIWAIGTGKHATPEQIKEMHLFIRSALKSQFGLQSNVVRIIYGGSVNAANSDMLASIQEVQGVLVGGASLIPDEFKSIINSFNQRKS